MMILLTQAISKCLWFRVAYYEGVVKKTSQKVPPYLLGGGLLIRCWHYIYIYRQTQIKIEEVPQKYPPAIKRCNGKFPAIASRGFMGERLGKGTDADRPWANRGSTKKENQMAVDKTPKEDLRIRELGWPRKDWKKRKCWRCYRQNRGGWWFQMGSPITWKSGRPPQNVVARFFLCRWFSIYFDPLEDAIVCKWCMSTRLWLFQSGHGHLAFLPDDFYEQGGFKPKWRYHAVCGRRPHLNIYKKEVSVYRF